MLTTDPLGHVGLSVGMALIVEHALRRRLPFSARVRQGGSPISHAAMEQTRSTSNSTTWLIDYRFVILGALLPDLLDRTVSRWLVPESLNPSGRMFAHTLLFAVLLLTCGLIVLVAARLRSRNRPAKRSDYSLLVLALASAGHLVVDRMWEAPATLWWPFYGFRFEGAEFDLSPQWLSWFQTGKGKALVDGTGACVLVIFSVKVYRHGSVLQWLKTGA